LTTSIQWICGENVTYPRRFWVTLLLHNLDKKPIQRGKHLQSEKKLKNAGPLSYVDLLMLTLTQHEKELCLIIEKLEEISKRLEEISLQISENRNQNSS